MMYKSPIELKFTEPFFEKLKNEADEYIIRACQRMVVTVDKEELVKALEYDRDQYMKGYADGRAYKPPLMTKGDQLRAMTDEELAEWIGKVTAGGYGMCAPGHYDCTGKDSCAPCWLDWLKEEADNGEN